MVHFDHLQQLRKVSGTPATKKKVAVALTVLTVDILTNGAVKCSVSLFFLLDSGLLCNCSC